ncbi:uncharacterized protein V1516DRAFT_678123 [Lipomyces oligophaga]|uniref:uncharacterized protein n=1 Tax=Lipomyces oligophaga TaxID=45792 RepID=UPI0034CE6D43
MPTFLRYLKFSRRQVVLVKIHIPNPQDVSYFIDYRSNQPNRGVHLIFRQIRDQLLTELKTLLLVNDFHWKPQFFGIDSLSAGLSGSENCPFRWHCEILITKMSGLTSPISNSSLVTKDLTFISPQREASAEMEDVKPIPKSNYRQYEIIKLTVSMVLTKPVDKMDDDLFGELSDSQSLENQYSDRTFGGFTAWIKASQNISMTTLDFEQK